MYFKKENSKINILNGKNNQIKINKIFNYSIFKINKNRLLLPNKYKLDIILYNIKNN